MKSIRAMWRRWFPPPVETTVACTVDGLDRFLQRLVDLAHPTEEQVAYGNLKAAEEVLVGVSLRGTGAFFLVDAGRRSSFIEFQSDDPAARITLRRPAAEALYHALNEKYGARSGQELPATIEVP